MKPQLRAICAEVLFNVIERGQSLQEALERASQALKPNDRALAQYICYGIIRQLPKYKLWVKALVSKPLLGKKIIVNYLLFVGLFQLADSRIPAHAAISETVNACITLKLVKFKALVNGVLRQFQRQQDELLARAENQQSDAWLHPDWLAQRIRQAYPRQAERIFTANQQPPPMWIRVNQQQYSVTDYAKLLDEKDISYELANDDSHAILLNEAVNVEMLPKFTEGACSVQDKAAQLAAQLLAPKSGEVILDACAAPGGKTGHLLEITPDIELTAIDQSEVRVERIHENLQRLGLTATVEVSDLATKKQTSATYDAILLDAPCSATGVIRRHPDIKWLRKAKDISQLIELQQQLLAQLWSTLKPGGRLLYATCSILPEENEQQIIQFLAKTSDAKLVDLPLPSKLTKVGVQILPGDTQQDGFYYAALTKIIL